MQFTKLTVIAAAAFMFAVCGGKESTSAVESASVDDMTEVTDVVEPVADGDSDVEEVNASESSSSDIDEVLDEYEKLLDKYVSLMKKAQAGDMSAMTEYAEYAQQCQRVAEKLENCKDEMTVAQATRFAKMAQKFSAAAM